MGCVKITSLATNAFNAIMPLSRASTRGRYSRIEGVTATLQNDLESLMTRLNEIPGRVQEWKKSSAWCGADVALSLVCVHCKEVRQDKLAAIKVANTQKHDFRSFMETFIAAATRIADGVDLDEFVEPASPPPAE